jgi:hypothetical protein
MSLLVIYAVGLMLKSTAKRYITAEAQRSQRKMRYRVLKRRCHCAYISFLKFSAPPASQRCAFAAKSFLKLILAAKVAASLQRAQHCCAYTGVRR